ncbi:CGL26 [Auxenochlorella protothecoides x Auxenochlorella symbiontica]
MKTLSIRVASSLLLLLLVAQIAFAEGPPKATPRRGDIKYIRCALCEHLAKHAWRSGRALLKTSTVSKKVDELTLLEHIEKLGTAWRSEGEWLSQLDIVKQGDKLVVMDKGELGVCGVACKTLEAAADDILASHDTDIAEALYTAGINRQAFTTKLCVAQSRACAAPPPPLPAGWSPYPAWERKAADGQDLDRVMGEMSDQGLRGKMYSREELTQQLEGLGEEEEEEGGAGEGDAPPAADEL